MPLHDHQIEALRALKERLPDRSLLDGATHMGKVRPGVVVHGTVGGIHLKDYELPPRRDYTQTELENAFGMIADKDDWRKPIRQTISLDFVPIAQAACEHFTATPLIVEAVFVQEGGPPKAIVSAVGYRAGPAGP